MSKGTSVPITTKHLVFSSIVVSNTKLFNFFIAT